ncbi:hypothetical protein J6590_063211 [Homalodisca vitripennis]|nr:hypothetical protein J6590_063211 [Homalodisca vitripennis]
MIVVTHARRLIPTNTSLRYFTNPAFPEAESKEEFLYHSWTNNQQCELCRFDYTLDLHYESTVITEDLGDESKKKA